MITIVIPTKNNPDSLNATLNSILSTTECTYEILIISTDANKKTKELLKEWEKLPYVKVHYGSFENSIKAMLYGMEQAKGDVLLTHDDVIFPNLYKKCWLTQMKELCTNNIGACTCLNGGGVSGPDYLNNFNWVGTWCFYLTKDTINKVGYIDDNFTTGEDIDYTYRIAKAGKKIAIANFWVDHHRSNDKPQDRDMANTNIVKLNGKYFKKKHGI